MTRSASLPHRSLSLRWAEWRSPSSRRGPALPRVCLPQQAILRLALHSRSMSLIQLLFLLGGIATVLGRTRSARLRRKGLCQRCGRRPPTARFFDVSETLAVCQPCSRALALPRRSLGPWLSGVASASVGAVTGALIWALLDDRISLAVALPTGAIAGGCVYWISAGRRKPPQHRVVRADVGLKEEGSLREPLS